LPKLFTGLLNNLFSFSASVAVNPLLPGLQKFFDVLEFTATGITEFVVGFEITYTTP